MPDEVRPPPSPDRFNSAYDGAPPPWDIGRAQPGFIAWADAGAIRGAVLDAGCGTGENALMCAARGLEVVGVDLVPKAIAAATAKAMARGLAARARFVVHDALDLGTLGRRFETVLDCGLFHVFDDDAREHYLASLRSALAPGGVYLMMCFSDREPTDWGGPRRVTEAELRATFTPARGFRVRAIEPGLFTTNIHESGGQAWRFAAERIGAAHDR